MSDELNDAKEWADITDAIEADSKEFNAEDRTLPSSPPIAKNEETKKETTPGQPTQYALYASGYAATTATVSTLPPGCYDIHADNRCVYVTPALKPSGILLELPEMRSEDVIKVVDSFWNSEDDYKIGNDFVIGGANFKAGIMIYGPPGCHAKGQGILMFDGSIKKVEDIKVNDQLMGPDSKPRTVLELRRGYEEMVRINPTKGTSFIVNRNHILHLTPSHANEIVRCPINMSVNDLLENTSGPFKERYKLTRIGVDFNKKELPIPPYILGIWLGDGHSHLAAITSMDKEIVNEWTKYGESLGLGVTINNHVNNKASTYTLSTQTKFGRDDRNKVLNQLRELEVLNNKHIPKRYLTSNREDRLQLLAGLIDTDGHANVSVTTKSKKGVGYDFISKWEHLANEMVFLCRSLGFAAYMRKCIKGCYVGKEQYFTGEYYRVSISGDLDEVPVRLMRKKCKSRNQIKNVLRTGFTFEKLPEDNFYGFTLNGDHLYLTDDFTIHHNSGKTCTIKLVTKKLVERSGTVFYASGPPTYLSSFLTDFAKIERDRKSIVIFEDFDSLIEKYREAEYLEILDSAKTIDNVLFIATTNYPERLDPRIYNRPGRFSHVIKIGMPGPKTREAYLKAILKNHRDVEEIVSKTSGFSIDHLTALINAVYREKKNLETEVERLRTLFKVPKSENKPLGIGIKRENEE
jgi:hypothetical protein